MMIYARGEVLLQLRQLDKSEADLLLAIDMDAENVNALYDMACLSALQAKVQTSCEWLKRTITLSDEYREIARQDHCFDLICDAPCFQALINPE